MNNVYLHSNEKTNSLVKLLIFMLIPFAIFGFYKNGIYLYQKELISTFEMFKPVLFIVISFFVSLIYSAIKKEKFISYVLLYNLIISLIAMPNTSIIVYLITLVVCNVIMMFIKYPIIPSYMLITVIISIVFKNLTFLNAFESAVEHKYSLIDYLLGYGYGGLSNTFLIFSIISLIILCTKFSFKKHIPLTAFTVFYSLLMITSFIKGNIDINLFLNNNFIFGVIFIAPLTLYSPYTKGGCFLYGIMLGLLSYISTFLDLNIGVYISLLLLELTYKIFDGKIHKSR